ncbi:MAG: VanW family protein [Lachnospiraceae bacterium]|nr:VanW family protein [Lachnospiraceae bacterium]
MKKIWKCWKWLFVVTLAVACIASLAPSARATSVQTAPTGVYIDSINVSGMTVAQAQSAVEEYVSELLSTEMILQYKADGSTIAEISATAAQLGAYWSNTGIVSEAVSAGSSGNVVERYKVLKDLEYSGRVYEVEITFDEDVLAAFIEENCTAYDKEAVDYSLTRSGGSFQIIAGSAGYVVDVETSAAGIAAALNADWDKETDYLELTVAVDEPQGSTEELSQVKDLLGSYSSSFSGSTSAKASNIANGAKLINGALLYPGEEFSFDGYAWPYTTDNGYVTGKAYEAGKVVDSVGGGICQVSSTLYNAVLRAELEVTMRYNHSMIVGYVPISSDATLAESSGKDFRFKNDTDYPVYVEAYVSGTTITVNIYGVETRASNRTVEYESVILETIDPGAEVITTDASQPIGYVTVSSAYTGYKAQLWKVVYIDGVEQSRTQVNSSTYKAVARSATFGIATDDESQLAAMNEAIATGSIDYTRAVMNQLLTAGTTTETTETTEAAETTQTTETTETTESTE